MRVVAIDDEQWCLDDITAVAERIPDVEIVATFHNAEEALRYFEYNEAELALLDIQMPGMNGLDLGRKLKQLCPEMVIFYATGYDEYIRDAMLDVGADFYLLKPFSDQQLTDAFTRAMRLTVGRGQRVRIQTFGRFELFIDDRPITFTSRKAKELLALCVHRRGAVVTMEEAVKTLWPSHSYNESVKTLYRQAAGYLRKLFDQEDVSAMFTTIRGGCGIGADKVSCDLYDFLRERHKDKFTGAYMADYPWASEMVPELWKRSGRPLPETASDS